MPRTGSTASKRRAIPLTVEDIEREIKRMDPHVNGRDLKIAVLLMSAVQLAPLSMSRAVQQLMDFTAYPKRIVAETVRRAEDNGIFAPDGRIAGKDWFKKDGAIAFWCDVACCAGLLRKVSA